MAEKIEYRMIPKEELWEILELPTKNTYFVGINVDQDEKIVILLRGDESVLRVPFSWFEEGAVEKPNFKDYEVIDYGLTIRFGNYEAAGDAILYDFDEDFRKKYEGEM